MDADRALSQAEIDALLSSIPQMAAETGAPEPAESKSPAVRYDFRAPDRFSKEQIRVLQMIHSTFGRHFSGSLSAALRCAVQVSFAHIEQSTFGDFSETIPDTVTTTVMTMDPLPGRCLVQFDLRVLLAAIDRLLGGRGKATKVEEDRELSDIELKLVHNLLEHFTSATRQAWSGLLEVHPTIVEVSSQNQLLHIALPSDAAVMVMFEIRMLDMSGMMNICLPYELLKPVTSKLTPQAWITAGSQGGDPESRKLVEQRLEKVPVSLSALLGTAQLAVRDLVDLNTGDVIVLDSEVQDEVALAVEDSLKFRGWPGVVRNRRAVKIARVLEEEGWL